MKRVEIKTVTGVIATLMVQDDEVALETNYYYLPLDVQNKIAFYAGRVLIPVSLCRFVFVVSKSKLIEIGAVCRIYN